MPTDDFDNWTVQVRKGVLELCILSALAERERYGLDLIRELTGVPGLGVKEGTLYPLLSRLRVQGLVKTRLEKRSVTVKRESPAYAATKANRSAWKSGIGLGPSETTYGRPATRRSAASMTGPS